MESYIVNTLTSITSITPPRCRIRARVVVRGRPRRETLALSVPQGLHGGQGTYRLVEVSRGRLRNGGYTGVPAVGLSQLFSGGLGVRRKPQSRCELLDLRQIPANLLGPQVQHLRAQRVPRLGVVHLRVGCDAMPGDAWVLGDETLVVVGALLILGQLGSKG